MVTIIKGQHRVPGGYSIFTLISSMKAKSIIIISVFSTIKFEASKKYRSVHDQIRVYTISLQSLTVEYAKIYTFSLAAPAVQLYNNKLNTFVDFAVPIDIPAVLCGFYTCVIFEYVMIMGGASGAYLQLYFGKGV